MKKEELKLLLNEIFGEAEKGRIIIDTKNNSMAYNVRFFTSVEGTNNTKNSMYPTVMISNRQEFMLKVQKYLEAAVDFYKADQEYFDLNDRDFKKLLLTCLFLNAGMGDFNNIIEYVETRTSQLQTIKKEVVKKVYENGQYVLYSKTEKLRPNFEGQYKETFYFDGAELGQYVLPSITYSEAGGKVYVYAVQGLKGKQKSPLASKLDRRFRVLNKGIDDEDYIKQVSPSSVASFILFIKKKEQEGYSEIEGVPYMPLRYQAKRNEIHIRGNKKNLDKEEIKETLKNQDMIQFNITNKLGYLFPRFVHHFPNTKIDYDFNNEKVVILLNKNEKSTGNIVHELEDLVK